MGKEEGGAEENVQLNKTIKITKRVEDLQTT